MELVPLQAQCPTCNSQEIFYTCHTTCCFNHLCNRCHTTFELATRVVGQMDGAFHPPEERDTSLPMVPCASCEGENVFQIEGSDQIVCVACHSLLALEYEKIVSDKE